MVTCALEESGGKGGERGRKPLPSLGESSHLKGVALWQRPPPCGPGAWGRDSVAAAPGTQLEEWGHHTGARAQPEGSREEAAGEGGRLPSPTRCSSSLFPPYGSHKVWAQRQQPEEMAVYRELL